MPPRMPAVSFGAVICLGFDDPWLPYAIKSVYEAVRTIAILVPMHPWYGPQLDARASVEGLKWSPDPEHKLRIVHGNWRNECEQRNYGLSLLRGEGHDVALIVDPDEVYDAAQVKAACGYVAAHLDAAQSFAVTWFTYWKSLTHRIDPIESFHPPLFVRIGRARFVPGRTVVVEHQSELPASLIMCHHLGFVRPERMVREKLHAMGLSDDAVQRWLEQTWLSASDPKSLENLHPLQPELYHHLVEQPIEALPPILQRLGQA